MPTIRIRTLTVRIAGRDVELECVCGFQLTQRNRDQIPERCLRCWRKWR